MVAVILLNGMLAGSTVHLIFSAGQNSMHYKFRWKIRNTILGLNEQNNNFQMLVNPYYAKINPRLISGYCKVCKDHCLTIHSEELPPCNIALRN